jgi:transposase-like protein
VSTTFSQLTPEDRSAYVGVEGLEDKPDLRTLCDVIYAASLRAGHLVRAINVLFGWAAAHAAIEAIEAVLAGEDGVGAHLRLPLAGYRRAIFGQPIYGPAIDLEEPEARELDVREVVEEVHGWTYNPTQLERLSGMGSDPCACGGWLRYRTVIVDGRREFGMQCQRCGLIYVADRGPCTGGGGGGGGDHDSQWAAGIWERSPQKWKPNCPVCYNYDTQFIGITRIGGYGYDWDASFYCRDCRGSFVLLVGRPMVDDVPEWLSELAVVEPGGGGGGGGPFQCPRCGSQEFKIIGQNNNGTCRLQCKKCGNRITMPCPAPDMTGGDDPEFYCPECGVELSESAVVCHNCGQVQDFGGGGGGGRELTEHERAEIDKAIDDAVQKGHLEKLPDGKLRLTPVGEAAAQKILIDIGLVALFGPDMPTCKICGSHGIEDVGLIWLGGKAQKVMRCDECHSSYYEPVSTETGGQAAPPIEPEAGGGGVGGAGRHADAYCPECGSSQLEYTGEYYDGEEHLGAGFECRDCGARHTDYDREDRAFGPGGVYAEEGGE